ncbi:YiiX/YebB-like N1pC/P60 family cysteine hydrolase [Chitinibacter sp. SCUT-21]|uniref:YiiX/YebB-like N1pC/P60 family cysteine hydrolase n=1 Tax=Chitinibacter sp. SCUT-21 TaxID=2970891 RepID=UPI0035A6591A
MIRLLLSLALLCPLWLYAKEFNKQFHEDVAALVALRQQAYQFAINNKFTEQRTPKLSRAQSNQMREMALHYIELRSQILPYATKVAPLFQTNLKLVLSTEKPTNAHQVLLQAPPQLNKGILNAYINPTDASGTPLIYEIQQGLAAALVLMDSFQIAIEPYDDNPTIGYLLTYDVNSKTKLSQLSNNYYSAEYRARLAKATRFVDQVMAWRRAQGRDTSRAENDLYALSQSTVWYVSLRQANPNSITGSLRHLFGNIGQQEQRQQNTLSYGVSMGFGNMIGLVKTRNGKLSTLSSAEQQNLARQLKPLDILLEKTPFRLSDKMIPGHYGHVAVWLGSEDELKAIGAWEQIPAQYQQKIRNGGRIVEALRSGVTISTLDHFLDIDDLLVLRQNKETPIPYKKSAALTAIEQVGKEYDFNFDVLTHERIVCSELAYVVFPDLPWPLAKTLGRYTISPDNVAQLAIQQQPILDPVVIYRDGHLLKDDLRAELTKLISNQSTIVASK